MTVLLYKNGYPPEWDEEVFEKVMEQAGNFKKWEGQPRYDYSTIAISE